VGNVGDLACAYCSPQPGFPGTWRSNAPESGFPGFPHRSGFALPGIGSIRQPEGYDGVILGSVLR
jgi:hypothetical protein